MMKARSKSRNTARYTIQYKIHNARLSSMIRRYLYLVLWTVLTAFGTEVINL